MTLAATTPAHSFQLLDQVDDLRHDLGKYISFETRFVGPDAEVETLRRALKADIFETHRRGNQVESAWELWARLRPSELVEDPDILLIEQHLIDLRAVDLDGARPALAQAAALAREITTATRRLAIRLHTEADTDDL